MSTKIYITGKVPGLTKNQLKELIQPEYTMASGVIKSLELLVTAQNAGQKRIQQAHSYGIDIMSWAEFVEHANLKEKVTQIKNTQKNES